MRPDTSRLCAALGLVLLLALGCGAHDGEHHADPPAAGPHAWCYTGACGPEHWGELAPEYAACQDGREQSPVDVDVEAASADPSAALLLPAYAETAVTVLNNGHTVQIDYDRGSTLMIGDDGFALQQFHFHAPSEHTVDGAAAAIEMHLVHRRADGALAVIGVLFDGGEPSPLLALFWDAIPASQGEQATAVRLNLADFLPDDLAYFHLAGSLTTPPCSERVSWYLLRQRLTASATQAEHFLAVVGANARPTQPLFARVVTTGG